MKLRRSDPPEPLSLAEAEADVARLEAEIAELPDRLAEAERTGSSDDLGRLWLLERSGPELLKKARIAAAEARAAHHETEANAVAVEVRRYADEIDELEEQRRQLDDEIARRRQPMGELAGRETAARMAAGTARRELQELRAGRLAATTTFRDLVGDLSRDGRAFILEQPTLPEPQTLTLRGNDIVAVNGVPVTPAALRRQRDAKEPKAVEPNPAEFLRLHYIEGNS